MKNLRDIESLSRSDINQIFEYAKYYKIKGIGNKILEDKVTAILFFENSTRTVVSFEMAAKRLGSHVIVFNSNNSSLNKHEDLEDTILNILAMKPEFMIIRSGNKNIIDFAIKNNTGCKIINAGESIFSHPTQALIDFFTLQELFLDRDFPRLNIAICGDIGHSRVARSNIMLMSKFNIKPVLIAPKYFFPDKSEYIKLKRCSKNEKIYHSLQSAFESENLDAILMLRIQKERLSDDTMKLFNELDYIKKFRLDYSSIAYSQNTDLKILHPGPINKEMEISSEIVKHKSNILDQVSNSVYIRQAIFAYLMDFKEKLDAL
ncbi:aspartate carbamoyltransferase catalytic subunit [Anaplasmataceae bacterium AB001_6]|nr:aspartate carbamoyltransferase catalytic subunit [Anaplasmataceae bacterium AB001_6]